MGRRWLETQIEEQVKDVKLTAEQNVSLLRIEMDRSKAQTQRAETAEAATLTMKSRVESSENSLLEQFQLSESTSQRVVEAETEVQVLRMKLCDKEQDIAAMTRALAESERDRMSKKEALDISAALLMTANSSVVELSLRVSTCAESEEDLVSRVTDTESLLCMKEEQVLELETRLERALHGWTIEKQASRQVTERLKKMTAANAAVSEQVLGLQMETALLVARLGQYSSLPMPVSLKCQHFFSFFLSLILFFSFLLFSKSSSHYSPPRI